MRRSRDAALIYGAGLVRSTTVGLVAILILGILLIAREIIRVHGGPRAADRLDALNVAIYPLLLTFIGVVVVRIVSLI